MVVSAGGGARRDLGASRLWSYPGVRDGSGGQRLDPSSWPRKPRSSSPTTRLCGCLTASCSCPSNCDLTAPPASPADGSRHIAASSVAGAWGGWRAWVEGEGLLLVYDGAGWIGTTSAGLQNMALLGLGTTADASNPFSAKINAALWTAKTVAEGGTGDLFHTINKEAAGDDLG